MVFDRIPSGSGVYRNLRWLYDLRGMLLGLTKSVSIAPLQDSFIAIGQGYPPSVAGWGLAIILGAMAVYTTFKGRASKIKYGIERRQ